MKMKHKGAAKKVARTVKSVVKKVGVKRAVNGAKKAASLINRMTRGR